MRIVVHGGLHKSGSTTVQGQWRAAFPGPEVWYPTVPRQTLPGHHRVFWPLLSTFREARDADLVWAQSRRPPPYPLGELLDKAQRKGTEVLVLSTEELDRLSAEDLPGLEELLRGHEVTFVLTVTPPAHRWASAWQQLVKVGLVEYPRDAVRHVAAYASLREGRLRELMGFPLWDRRVVRLVRTSPHEDDLARSLAEHLGLPWAGEVDEPEARNVSLGTKVEVLRRINANDLSLGVAHGPGRAVLARLTQRHTERVPRPELAEAYTVPEEIWRAAEAEHAFLTSGRQEAGVEVVDPHGLLEQWRSRELPSWYREVAGSEVAVPELDHPRDLQEQLWRVRQQRAGLQTRLDRMQEQLAEARAELAAASAAKGSADGASPRRLLGAVRRGRREVRG